MPATSRMSVSRRASSGRRRRSFPSRRRRSKAISEAYAWPRLVRSAVVLPGSQTSTSSNRLNGPGIERVWSSEMRYNVDLETRDEDVVWIGEHCPFRRHIG
jgi:hypothetical protein